MTILPAGSFKVSDYRKAIPGWVKLQVVLDRVSKIHDDLQHELLNGADPAGAIDPVFVALREFPVDARKLRFDHRPALLDRPYDLMAGDFIPPQNDQKHIEAILAPDHDERTFGRKAAAERTVTTRGSDVGEAKRTRDIRASEAMHDAKLASKAGDYAKAAAILASVKVPRKKLNKRKIPSRPFPQTQRPFPTTRRAR